MRVLIVFLKRLKKKERKETILGSNLRGASLFYLASEDIRKKGTCKLPPAAAETSGYQRGFWRQTLEILL